MVLWQVQTTFLSVGFAGLAVAAQLFSENPLAIGASRNHILHYVRAGWFAGVGLAGNVTIGVEALWLSTDIGLVVSTLWFAFTVGLLAHSYLNLIKLLGTPSVLDEVVSSSLKGAIVRRLASPFSQSSEERIELESLFQVGPVSGTLGTSRQTLRVPVPRVEQVVKRIRPSVVRRAMMSLDPKPSSDDGPDQGVAYTKPHFSLLVESGDRTRAGDTAFTVKTAQKLDEETEVELVRLLQSSFEFERPDFVTVYEMTNREISTIKDAISVHLRMGAYSVAERSLELLGRVVREVWLTDSGTDATRKSSFTRRDWLYRSTAEVEQDALLSRRACEMFVRQATQRTYEAARSGPIEYVEHSLTSFRRIWLQVIRNQNEDFRDIPLGIVSTLRSLTQHGFAINEKDRYELQARGVWAIVDIVKDASDCGDTESASLAAKTLTGLFKFSGSTHAKGQVRAGQLVISAWLEYLQDKKDIRAAHDPGLRALLALHGSPKEIVEARAIADRAASEFSRWDMWEVELSLSGEAQILEFSGYVDAVQVKSLLSTFDSLPSTLEHDVVDDYKRFLRLLQEKPEPKRTPREEDLMKRLEAAIEEWGSRENDRLSAQELSQERVALLHKGISDELNAGLRIAECIPNLADDAHASLQQDSVLGLNFRVSKHFFVDEIFNQTYADPQDLGNTIGRSMVAGEDRKILEQLKAGDSSIHNPTIEAIEGVVRSLGEQAQNYIFAIPFGGLDGDWYAEDFQESLRELTCIETPVLEEEAILFDSRSSVVSTRAAEPKDGLSRVPDTTVAVGVFEFVGENDEPQVRVEVGEVLALSPGSAPHVHRFGWLTDARIE